MQNANDQEFIDDCIKMQVSIVSMQLRRTSLLSSPKMALKDLQQRFTLSNLIEFITIEVIFQIDKKYQYFNQQFAKHECLKKTCFFYKNA